MIKKNSKHQTNLSLKKLVDNEDKIDLEDIKITIDN
jgi:hypothetical protein